MHAITTADFLSTPELLWQSLDYLGAMVLECLMIHSIESLEHEVEKAGQRQVRDRLLLEKAMRELHSVMDPRRKDEFLTDSMETPLFSAFRLVAEQRGLKVLAPSRLGGQHAPEPDLGNHGARFPGDGSSGYSRGCLVEA